MYTDKLDDIVNKYNNTYHSTIKMNPVDVRSNTYIDSRKGINNNGPKYKIGDIVRISKYNIFAEGFVIKKVKNTVSWTYVTSNLKDEEIVGIFYKEELQESNQKEFRVEKVTKKKDDKLFVKWKGYDSSFNSWIDNKDIT